MMEFDLASVASTLGFLKGTDLAGPYAIKRYLKEKGFRRLLDGTRRTSDFVLVQIVGNVVREVDGDFVRQTMLDEAEAAQLPEDLLDTIVTWNGFSKVAPLLPALSYDGLAPDSELFSTMRDSPVDARFPFRNGVVVVTRDGATLCSHDPQYGTLWEHDLIDRDAIPDAPRRKGLFEQFCESAFTARVRHGLPDWRDEFELTPTQNQHYRAFRACMGYLLHTYKDPANARAVIFLDMESDDTHAMGGSGKSVTLESCRHLRRLVVQDAQRYQQSRQGGGRFQFSDVTSDTKLILLNDAKKGFDFQELFNMITGDIQVERKNEHKWKIPFSRAPKIAISTNYVMPPEGVSFMRRRYVVAFGSYWTQCIREGEQASDAKHLGKRLFDDFDPDDWQDFDNYMFDNVCLYLREGVNEGALDAIRQREQAQRYGADFIEWGEEFFDGYPSRGVDPQSGERIDDLFKAFRAEYPTSVQPRNDTEFAQALMDLGQERSYEFNAHYANKGATASQRRWRRKVHGQQLNHVVFTQVKRRAPRRRSASAQPHTGTSATDSTDAEGAADTSGDWSTLKRLQTQYDERVRLHVERALNRLIRAEYRARRQRAARTLRGMKFPNPAARQRAITERVGIEPDEVLNGVLSLDAALLITTAADVERTLDRIRTECPSDGSGLSVFVAIDTLGIGSATIARCVNETRAKLSEPAKLLRLQASLSVAADTVSDGSDVVRTLARPRFRRRLSKD